MTLVCQRANDRRYADAGSGLEVWDDPRPAAIAQEVHETAQTDSIASSAVKLLGAPVAAPLAAYRALTEYLVYIVNLLQGIATVLEQLSNCLNFADPLVTGSLMAVLLALCLLASFLIATVGVTPVIFIGGILGLLVPKLVGSVLQVRTSHSCYYRYYNLALNLPAYLPPNLPPYTHLPNPPAFHARA